MTRVKPRATASVLLLLACAGAHEPMSKRDLLEHSSPWCLNHSAPATVGMYGSSLSVDLTGPKDPASGAYRDVPAKVAGLFQQGWAHVVGFNYREALRNFEAAILADPECALCHWGRAISFSPNINYYVEKQSELNQSAERAAALVAAQPHLLPKTKALVASALALVQDPRVPDGPSSVGRRRYADSLCAASSNMTADEDLAALCAGALMALSPWHYYNGTHSYGHDALLPFLRTARSKLLAALSQDPRHALAIHLLIHLEEPENAPEGYRWEAVPHDPNLSCDPHTHWRPSQRRPGSSSPTTPSLYQPRQ